jgi:DNA-directed RNA polymerase specialized sigma24 family protein
LRSFARVFSQNAWNCSKTGRELIAWRYGEGLRVTAIAQRLGRTASAVSVQLFALRKMLRDCVADKLAREHTGTKGSS